MQRQTSSNHLFSRLLQRRLRDTLNNAQSVDQAGFRKMFSTDDHPITLSQIQERAYQSQKTVWIAFVDYKKAFDTVSQEG